MRRFEGRGASLGLRRSSRIGRRRASGGIRGAGPRACRDEGRKPGAAPRHRRPPPSPAEAENRDRAGNPADVRRGPADCPDNPRCGPETADRVADPGRETGCPAAPAGARSLRDHCRPDARRRRPACRRRAAGRSARRSVAAGSPVAAADRVLPLGGRSETVRQGAAEIAVVIHLVAFLSGRPLLTALRKRLRGLGGGNQPEVMFGMLQIILRRDGISPCVGVSRELEIFLGDMMRVAAYFDIRAVQFVGSRQRIGPPPIVCRPAAHPFVLTWSHFDFPTSIPLSPGLSCRFGARLARIWRKTAIHFRVTRMG